MTRKVINTGTAANDRSGDTLRAAFGKVNDNFQDLYSRDSALSLVARTGQYSDLNGRPMEFDGTYGSLHGKPTLFSGSYNDLSDKPTLFSGSYNDLSNKPTLFSGSYSDLTNKPTLFNGSYQDLTDKPNLFSGSYNDLSDKPDAAISISALKAIAAQSTDFLDFKNRIEAL